MKNITLYIACLLLFLLGACAPSYRPIYMSKDEFQKSFGKNFITTCVRYCSGSNFKSLYDEKNWYGLAYAEYTTGSHDDLGYYYMGVAAENLNFQEMSQKYYEAALSNSGKAGCGTKSTGCDGFNFPSDIYTKLDKFAQQQGHPNYQAKLSAEKAVVDADLKKRAAQMAEEERKARLQSQAAKDAEIKRQLEQERIRLAIQNQPQYSVNAANSPIRARVGSVYESGWNQRVKYLYLQSKANDLLIEDIELNRGNCQNVKILPAYFPQFPFTIQFGDTARVILDMGGSVFCDLLEAKIRTNKGVFVFD